MSKKVENIQKEIGASSTRLERARSLIEAWPDMIGFFGLTKKITLYLSWLEQHRPLVNIRWADNLLDGMPLLELSQDERAKLVREMNVVFGKMILAIKLYGFDPSNKEDTHFLWLQAYRLEKDDDTSNDPWKEDDNPEGISSSPIAHDTRSQGRKVTRIYFDPAMDWYRPLGV